MEFALREKGRGDPRLHAAELSGGTGGFTAGRRIFRAAGNRRRADQGAGDAAVYEGSVAGGRGDEQLYDRRYGRHQRIYLLGTRGRARGDWRAASGRRVCGVAAGGGD